MNVDNPGKAAQRDEPAQMCTRNVSEPQAQGAMAATQLKADEATHPAPYGSFSSDAVCASRESAATSLSEPKPGKGSPKARMHSGGKTSTSEANSSVNRATLSTGRTVQKEQYMIVEDDSGNYNHDERTSSNKSIPKGKKDRSSLRKGKWTVEEEEYASRLIHYFNLGLLTVPGGSTLRCFLAEKLNCDPMRITKKFAGTYGWGKRAYQSRDHLHSMVDIEMARAELAWLERRFHLRLERGQKVGVPLSPPSAQATPSSPTGANQAFMQAQTTSAIASAWQQTHGVDADSSQTVSPLTMGPTHSAVTLNASPLSVASARPEWQPAALSRPAAAVPPLQQPSTTSKAVWALAQAAASMTPSISQLVAANLHHLQLQPCAVSTSAASVTPSRLTISTPTSPKHPVSCDQALSGHPSQSIASCQGTSTANLLRTSDLSPQATPYTLGSNSSKGNQVEESILTPESNNFEDTVELKEEEHGLNSPCGGDALRNQDSFHGQTYQDESEPFASHSTSIFQAGKRGYVSASEESEREQVVGPPTKRFKKRKRVADLSFGSVQEHNSRWDARRRSSLRRKRHRK